MSAESTQPTVTPAPVDQRVVWLLFGGGALICLLLACAARWTPAAASATDRAWMAWLGIAQALAFAGGAALAARSRLTLAALMTCGTGVFATTAASLVSLPSLSLHLLGFLGYLVCIGAVFAGRRAAFLLAAVSAAIVVAVAGLRPGQGTSATVIAMLLVLTGLLVGLLHAFVLEGTLSQIRQRERRFQGLLNIAADLYWELDTSLRMTRLSRTSSKDGESLLKHPLGKTPWEPPSLEPTAQEWQEHRRDLEARRPFRNFRTRRAGADGTLHYASVSGEPVFDDAGRFSGYWGVVRYVDAEVQAERATLATATRYRRLFERSPSPMIAHREGRVIHVNEAAALLFGYLDAAAMQGAVVVDHYDDAPTRARALERLARLDSLPAGERLPMADFTLRRLDGVRVDVQVTSLLIDLEDGPAALSIYSDVTARKAAEQSLLRNQKLLTQLFATTPDIVTLGEYESGRFLMINDRFTQLLGWTRDEAVGRSATELGIYDDDAVRDELREQVATHGSVRDVLIMCRTKAGHALPLRVSGALFTIDSVHYVVSVARDVSAAEQSRLERDAILKHVSIGVALLRDGRFVHANPRFEQMFGWTIGALAGEEALALWPHSDDAAQDEQVSGPPLMASSRSFETERAMRRRDGSVFWCRLAAQEVDPADPSRGGTIWIAEDVTERRQVQRSLAAARDAAEAASRAKSRFLANTSHEIRTPLNALIGLAQLAQRPDLPAEPRRAYLAQILESARSLSALISNVLDLSKIEAGKFAVESLAFDLRQLVGDACRGYQVLAEARGLALSWQVDPAVPAAVQGDPTRVRQILGNFVSNALKFTDRGDVRVEVASGGDGDRVRLTVIDSGPGIDAELRGRLFKPFTQADESTTRRYGGTGLGLSICSELAGLMGGAVGVESEGARGSRFWVELPLPATTAAQAVPFDETSLLPYLYGARVLVAEDNAVNMMIVSAMLEAWGVQVERAADGQQALDAVDAARCAGRPIDVVLMDVQMPVMSGHEATQRLRAQPEAADLPIVALTAAALVSEREEALAAGMDAFLTKPIDSEQLLRTLAGLLRLRGAGAATAQAAPSVAASTWPAEP